MKWKSSYYFRLVLSYTVLALVLIGITGGYLLTNANRMVTSEVSKDARYGLLNIKDLVENNFLRFYEDAFFNKVLMTFNKESNEEIQYLLEHPAEGNVSRIVRFITDLGLIKEMTPGLDGVTVYMRKSGYAMDQNRYYESPNNSTDAAFIRTLDTTRPNHWFMREKPDQPGHQVMTYVFALPYNSPPANATGFLYLDISMTHMKEMVGTVLNFPQSHLYMFDENGQLMLGADKAKTGEINAVQQALADSAMNKAASDSFSRYGNQVISVLPKSDSQNRWNYAVVRPMDSFLLSSNKMKRQVWTACLIALLGGIMISFLMSRHFYMPLKKLLYSIRNLYSGPAPVAGGYEYTTINHMLMCIDLSMLQMKDQVRMNQVTGLITGQQTAAGLGNLPAIPMECRYVVAYIVKDSDNGERLIRVLGEMSGLKAELVSLSATELALLVFLYDPGIDSSEFVRKALEGIRSDIGTTFGAGIGRLVDTVEAIQQSYQEAVQAYKYSYIRGKEAIIPYDEIAACQTTLLLPDIGYELLQHKVQAGSSSEVELWLEELTPALKSATHSVETVELVCMRLAMVLTQVVIEQKLNGVFPVFGFHERFKQRTLDETLAALKDQAVSMAKYIHESRNDVHLDKISSLKFYIGEHMADDLSLEELAGRVNLSPNYVSTLFGSITGESFTEYLNRIRLERAATILVTERKLTVAEIATSVGYRNSQYFCTKFKAKFGITPLQFRASEKMQESLAK